MLAGAQAAGAKCVPGTAGIKLPAGFCATVFADSIRGARELTVAPNGDVFVSVQGRTGGGVVSLRDTNHDGKADEKKQFASGFTSSAVALYGGYLYTEYVPPQPPGTRTAPGAAGPTISIIRYRLRPGALTASGAADTIVSGLPGTPGHSTRNFVISKAGVLYVNVGSPTNSCQPKDRAPYVAGENPCTELETRAGIWKFDARKTHQTEATGVHMARGIRNAVGIALHP
ncbi:MAG: sorbosone dehydrogenase, partial [Gemmatimonadaceae bacterium]